MGKVKKCLNLGCTEWILVDDGRTVIQPTEECDISGVPKDYKKQIREIAEQSTETIYVSRRLFNVKKGDDIPI